MNETLTLRYRDHEVTLSIWSDVETTELVGFVAHDCPYTPIAGPIRSREPFGALAGVLTRIAVAHIDGLEDGRD